MAQQSPVMSHGPNKGLKRCKLIGHAVLLSPRLGAKLAQKTPASGGETAVKVRTGTPSDRG
jgi:hypothetical protein